MRELENRVKRAVIMSAGSIIQPADLDLPLHGDAEEEQSGNPENPTLIATDGTVSLKEAKEITEKRLILNALLR